MTEYNVDAARRYLRHLAKMNGDLLAQHDYMTLPIEKRRERLQRRYEFLRDQLDDAVTDLATLQDIPVQVVPHPSRTEYDELEFQVRKLAHLHKLLLDKKLFKREEIAYFGNQIRETEKKIAAVKVVR